MKLPIVCSECMVEHIDSGGNGGKPLKMLDQSPVAHYGFTGKELDFIPSTTLRAGIPSARLRAGNYDIKYRMGPDTESDEESRCRVNQKT